MTKFCFNDLITGVKVLKIWKLASVLMDFDLFSQTVLDIQIWATFEPVLEWRQNQGLRMGHNITILKNWNSCSWIII